MKVRGSWGLEEWMGLSLLPSLPPIRGCMSGRLHSSSTRKQCKLRGGLHQPAGDGKEKQKHSIEEQRVPQKASSRDCSGGRGGFRVSL